MNNDFTRREILVGAAAVGAAASTELTTLPAFAWTHGKSPVVSVAGRSTINLGQPSYDDSYPFINFCKASQGLTLVNSALPTNNVVEPGILDANGYPFYIPVSSSGVITSFFIPEQTQRSGNYVFKWTGNGVMVTGPLQLISYTITGIVSDGGSNTVVTCSPGSAGNNLFNLRVGQPIQIAGISGTGWSGVNAIWKILSVNTSAKTFTVGYNSFSAGAPSYSSALASNVGTTILTGSGGPTVAGGGRCVGTIAAGYGGPQIISIGTSSVYVSGATAAASDYPYNWIFCHEDDETLVDGGEMFGTHFKQVLGDLKSGVIRFENWNGTVSGNMCSTWMTRMSPSYNYWAADEYRPSIYAGAVNSTASATYGCNYIATVPATYAYAPGITPTPLVHTSDGTTWVNGDAPRNGDVITVWLNNNAAAGITAVTPSGSNTILTVTNGSNDPNYTAGQKIWIKDSSFAINTITWSSAGGGTATVTTTANHNITSSFSGTIINTSVAGYNGTYTFTITGANTFTYSLASNPGSSSSGGTYSWLNGTYTISAASSGAVTIPLNSTNTAASFVSTTYNFGGLTVYTVQCYPVVCSLQVGTLGTSKPLLTAPAQNRYPTGDDGDYNSMLKGQYWVSLATANYDGQLGVWVMQGGTIGDGRRGLNNPVPFEVCLQLCVEMGMHPYWNAPVFALDPPTDFIGSLATLCKTSGSSWMIPRFETPDEMWNSAFVLANITFAKGAVFNGVQIVGGLIQTDPSTPLTSPTSFTVTAASYNTGAGTVTLTMSPSGNTFQVGSQVQMNGFNASNFGGDWVPYRTGYVSAINVGGNPNVITVLATTTFATGAYVSGGTVNPVYWFQAGYDWGGRIASTMGQDLASVYGIGNLGTSYYAMVGVQSGIGIYYGYNQTSSSIDSLNSPSWQVAATPPSGYTATPAYNWLSHICGAQYFTPNAINQPIELTWAQGLDPKMVLSSTITNGVMSIPASGVKQGGAAGIKVGDVIFGEPFPLMTNSGVTPLTVLSIQGTPGYTTGSDGYVNGNTNAFTLHLTYDGSTTATSVNWNFADGFFFATNPAYAQYFADDCMGAHINGTISGTTLTVNSYYSNSSTIVVGDGPSVWYPGADVTLAITGGSYPTFTLNAAPSGGNVTGIEMYVGACYKCLPVAKNLWQAWYNWAQTFTNNNGQKLGLHGYEGGYSPDYVGPGGQPPGLQGILRFAAKQVTSSPNMATGMYGYSLLNFNNYVAVGGVFPADYELTGPSPSNEAWPILETIYQKPYPPRFRATNNFNGGSL